ncbi:DUF6188 family protein [Priestia iocasae]|uniref:Uncharacterized protein n=1 Tax=Priestia iocasae TaxID=2291674 RepID=A0ABS2QWY6_9BACI|nr:DUF6188 family protein [Metabacillus iocasae]MBM7703925.1 hypothetical protein [Metabacillus iocasae]
MNEIDTINFTSFINQVVLHVSIDEHPLMMTFTEGGIVIECPWRLRKKDKIIVGQADWNASEASFHRQRVKSCLLGHTIQQISWCKEIGLMRIEFEEDYVLDVFHDSTMYEGWDLYGNDGFSFISLPGGVYDYRQATKTNT